MCIKAVTVKAVEKVDNFYLKSFFIPIFISLDLSVNKLTQTLMKHVSMFLLIVLLASCQKELTKAKPAAVKESAAIIQPVVDLGELLPEPSVHTIVTSGTRMKVVTITFTVSNAPCSLYHFRLVLDHGAGILFKRNVLTLNTLVIQGVKPRLEMDLFGTKVPVLEYDFSAAPVRSLWVTTQLS